MTEYEKPNINPETIRRARQANLGEYLISQGEPIERAGNERYRHKEHDSLTFTGNAYYWNSLDEHGNAIDYLVRHMNKDFKTALSELVAFDTAALISSDFGETSAETFVFSDIKIENDVRRSIAYLNKTRGIDYKIIKSLIESKLLFQEENNQAHNIIFPIYDEQQEIVGAEIQGTLTAKRFKGIKTGSKYGYGYNINPTNSDIIKYMLFFESAVDLLSFWNIKSLENKTLNGCLLVSMAGLKENIVRHMLNASQEPVQAFLCVDNDVAGENFINAVTEQIKGIQTRLPQAEYKDWNEQLQAIRRV